MFYKDFKGNKISTLGFGVMRMPTDPENPKIFDRKAGQAIIDRAMELGINYFDTAHIYQKTDSEKFLGEALKKYPRKVITLPLNFTAAPSGIFARLSLSSWSGCKPTISTFICFTAWKTIPSHYIQTRNWIT